MPNIIESDTSEPLFGPAWVDAACSGLDDAGRDLVLRAARWVAGPLADVRASTGAPMDQHCAAVVCILAGIGADAAARASALLAVLPQPAEGEEKGAGKDPLLHEFGPEVLTLVRGTRTLLRLSERAWQASDNGSPSADQKEMHRKMLLAMAADLRIVLMRLASRLQSLRWYASTRTECPKPFAVETMELYTPLANRLGIWQLKWEMEDLAFRFLEPDTYRAIARQLEEKRTERTAFIDAVVQRLQRALQDENISAKVYGRPKHIYSIWNKMRVKHLEFDQLFDLRALRVIADDERACYGALALVHSLWIPVSDEFDDYISRPKPNGYRSLHTVVASSEGKPFEVQIRTQEMHQFAEYGMAAHWRYKESGARGGEVAAVDGYDRKISWMRQLLAWDKGDGPAPRQAPLDNAAASRAGDHIYVMTPQARVIELPSGATPVDFAYHLHTDLGHRCRGAKVDGQMVPLQTHLSTGQTVEVVAAKSGGPSRDWLNPQLGFLASPRSRSKVRAWFNAIELQHRISQGQALVEKELQRLGKTSVNQEQLAQQLGFARADDMYVAAAKEEFSLRQIGHTLNQDNEAPDESGEPAVVEPGTSSVVKTGKSGVLVVGVDSLLTQFARCCRPAPPDPIVGFVTRGRGVSIHRRDCASYAAILKRYPERAIDVSWGDTNDAVYPVDIRIFAQDHSSLLHDLSDVFARLRLRVVSIQTQSRRSLSQTVFTVEVKSGDQIDRALTALNELTGVSASR